MNRLAIGLVLFVCAAPAAGQDPALPWRGENLKYFPSNIARERLTQRMREFSFALGVRCQHCHAGGDGVSFDGVDFASDAKPAKLTARAMLRLVDQLNHSALPALPSRAEPRVTVDCVTCHRGLPLPKTLQTILLELIASDGVATAVRHYRQLRNADALSGRYDFGQWEMNELARRLTEMNNTAAAVAILEMNGEFYPDSAEIDFQLGELHRVRGERERAVARYRATLKKAPQHRRAHERIEQLEKP